jgi:hypothetical protein
MADAAAVLTGMGGGAGGDFGGDTGDTGADGGDTGFTGDETGTGTGTGDGAGDDGSGGEPEYEIDESTGEPKLDAEGNQIPKTVSGKPEPFKATYEKIKAADPKAAEIFRKEHFGYEKYKQLFPTTADATAAKEALETYGGVEGIEQVNQKAQQFASEMEQFSQGSPEFLSQLQKDDPTGFSKSISRGLGILGQADPTAYSSALSPIIHSTLEAGGINSALYLAGTTISEIFAQLEQSGADQKSLFALNKAFDAVKKAYDYSGNIKKLAEQSGEKPLTDKEKELQQREQEITRKHNEQFSREVSTAAVKSADSIINQALLPYYKALPKMSKEQKADVHKGVFEYISRQLESNKKYMEQKRALIREGNVDKITKFISQNVQKLAAASAKSIWNRRGWGTLPNQQKTNAGNNNQQVTLTRKPKKEDIDWNKTTEIEYMTGSATLKGSGRKVKFDWNRVQD